MAKPRNRSIEEIRLDCIAGIIALNKKNVGESFSKNSKLLTDYHKYDIIYLLLLIPFVELHTRFDAGLVKVNANLGKEYATTNNNQDVFADGEIEGFDKGRLFFSYSPNLIP